jgi:putative FmdB family regulatory protein
MNPRGGFAQMPIYEYECIKCHKIEEVLQKFSDKPLTRCKQCSGKLQKLISHNSFHLKGTGWYVTDYAAKSRGSAAESKPPDTSSSSESKTGTSDSKKTKKSTD